jgi:hypothetical protein
LRNAKCSGYPFFRSYGARLPSSLTRFHSRALAHLCPPTCVGLRYGRPREHFKGFLGSSFDGSALAEASTSPATSNAAGVFTKCEKRIVLFTFNRSSSTLEVAGTGTFNRRTISTKTSLQSLTAAGAGILNLLSIVYALRPRLRSRLTLGGRTFPRKPWVYGGQEFHLSYRYSCLHSHL